MPLNRLNELLKLAVSFISNETVSPVMATQVGRELGGTTRVILCMGPHKTRTIFGSSTRFSGNHHLPDFNWGTASCLDYGYMGPCPSLEKVGCWYGECLHERV